MNLTRFYFLTFLIFSLSGLFAQQVTISPVPQNTVWGQKAFDNTTVFNLQGEATADLDAVNLLKSKLNVNGGGVELIVGKRGDALMASVDTEIPAVREGYYLKIEPGKVTIAGNDNEGTYYGVQTFLQLMSASDVMSVTIKDFPSVIERGVIEGFYGNPFSQADRISQFEFYGKNKLNAYIYGPKDDPYHGFSNRWRDPYPADKALQIKELIVKAHENKVNFVWAVHPGNDINWVDNDGDGVIDDFKACVNKFELMYDLGVRSFAVFFDDIGGVGTDPINQAKMLNYLTNEFVNKKSDVAPMILCPTQYNQAWSSGDYLSILGTQMDESVRIMWTGKSVVRMIDKETMNWINQRIKRNAYIWLNYPVTDYVVDHILMGPVVGNSTDIEDQLAGFTANPMEYAEASKVALFSIADYTWNMKDFDPQTSWLNGLKFLQPDNFDAFKIFCENNVDLGPTFHGLRMPNESVPFKTVADPFLEAYRGGNYNGEQADLVSAQFQSFRDAGTELMASTYNVPLINEIKPWLQVFDMIGEKGNLLMDMAAALQADDSVAFVRDYLAVESIEDAQKLVRSRDFPGSIKSPNPKPANEVVAPFIKQFKALLVMEYRRNYNYRLDIFPKILIEEGNYYIKVNGKFLTNQNVNGSGGNPAFVTEPDAINPQRQEWTLTIDPQTERYKIVNAQDGRYINELGNFGTNVYEAVWHTYKLFRLNGKYAIQNAGSAGDKLWMFEDNRIKRSDRNELKVSEFIFEIIPVGDGTVSYMTIEPDETYHIRSGDNYLTNLNVGGSGGVPRFRALETPVKESQQWVFTVDATTDRYKLVSFADSRYVNEFGVFGTNAYFPTWNTYVLTEMGNSYAIQNAGESGTKFWGRNNDRIEQVNAGRNDSYIFEIIPSSEVIPTGMDRVKQPKEFSLRCSKSEITVDGGQIAGMSLYTINGRSVRKLMDASKMNVEGLPKGIYVLNVKSTQGNSESFKVLMK